MRKHSLRLRGGVRAARLLLLFLLLGCANEDPDVAVKAESLYLGTLNSMSPGETQTFRLPANRGGVEYTIVAGGWVRPVPLDGCDVPFCRSETDWLNFKAWEHQYAFQYLRLRVQNHSSVRITTQYKSQVDCVYASGNPLPAPWQTFDDESHEGRFSTTPGEAEEFEIGCMDYGAGSTFDGAWPVRASVDVSVHDDNPASDPFDDPMDPLDNPWD